MQNGNNGRNTDGKFAKGNPGKPKGARHRATQAVQELLEGEAELLTRKAVEVALSGDVSALRLCLERLAPPMKSSPIKFSIPEIKGVDALSPAAASIIEDVSEGNLTASEGTQVMQLIDTYRRTLELTDIEHRVSQLEQNAKWH